MIRGIGPFQVLLCLTCIEFSRNWPQWASTGSPKIRTTKTRTAHYYKKLGTRWTKSSTSIWRIMSSDELSSDSSPSTSHVPGVSLWKGNQEIWTGVMFSRFLLRRKICMSESMLRSPSSIFFWRIDMSWLDISSVDFHLCGFFTRARRRYKLDTDLKQRGPAETTFMLWGG